MIESLCNNPERYAAASENHLFDFTLRQIAFGVGHGATHRALFTIRGDKVYVYSIRHLAQRDVTPEDFQ